MTERLRLLLLTEGNDVTGFEQVADNVGLTFVAVIPAENNTGSNGGSE